MTTAISNIIHSATKTNYDQCNILCLLFDGFFEILLTQTNHNFYVTTNNQPINWLTSTLDAPHKLSIYKNIDTIPDYINFDALLCNDRVKLYQQTKMLAKALHIPTIFVDHYDYINFKKEDIYLIQQNRGDLHVCASNVFSNLLNFEYTDIISYGLPLLNTESINERTNNILIIGDYPSQQQLIYQLKHQYNALILTEKEHPQKFYEIENIIKNTKFFISMHNETNIDIITLLAMSAGCVVICHANTSTAKIINHGYNGIIVNNVSDLITHINSLLQQPNTLQNMSNAAKDNIKIQFNENVFINKWNNIFSKLNTVVYKG